MHIKKAAEVFSAVFFMRSQCLQGINLCSGINLYPEAFGFAFTICEKRMESIEPVR